MRFLLLLVILVPSVAVAYLLGQGQVPAAPELALTISDETQQELLRCDNALFAGEWQTAEQSLALLAASDDATTQEHYAVRADVLKRSKAASEVLDIGIALRSRDEAVRKQLLNHLQALADPSPAFTVLLPCADQGDQSLPWLCLASSLLESTDGGRTWVNLGKRLPVGPNQTYYTRDLQRAPDDPKRLFLSSPGKDGRMGYLSHDGGRSWEEMIGPQPGDTTYSKHWHSQVPVLGGQGQCVVILKRSDPSSTVGRTAHQCFVSHDDGKIWQRGAIIQEPRGVLAHPEGSFLLTWRIDRGRTNLPKMSLDGGLTFQQVTWDAQRWPEQGLSRGRQATVGALGHGAAYIPLPEGRILVLGFDGRLQDSRASVPADLFDAEVEIALHPTLPERLYLLHPKRGLWRSDDGGRSFRPGRSLLATLAGRHLRMIAGTKPRLVWMAQERGRNIFYAFQDVDIADTFFEGPGMP